LRRAFRFIKGRKARIRNAKTSTDGVQQNLWGPKSGRAYGGGGGEGGGWSDGSEREDNERGKYSLEDLLGK